MKTNLLTLAFLAFLFQIPMFAQDRTTVNATSNEISDNLDLRAVASIFGDARDLQDFERRLNDPKNQISNLDLNFDRQVDYLRVIEAVEKNTHLIILQAVLEKDVFQDVATIEVERDRNNNVQIQVVGDVYMYGQNYIYEPVYVHRPMIYNVFWVHNYNPYYSPYYYNYYPTYYYAWTPYPVYRYRRNVHVHINQYNYYNYCDNRRSSRAVAMYETRRNNGYERRNPNQSFVTRNGVTNRHELQNTRNAGTRVANSTTRNYNDDGATRRNNNRADAVKETTSIANVRSNSTLRNVNTATPDRNVRNAQSDNVVRNSGNGTIRSSAPAVRDVHTTTPDRNVRNAQSDNVVRNSGSSTVRSTAPTVRNTTSAVNSGNRNYSQSQPNHASQQSSPAQQSNSTRNSGSRNSTRG